MTRLNEVVLMVKVGSIGIPYKCYLNSVAKLYNVMVFIPLLKTKAFNEEDQKHMATTNRRALVAISFLNI